LSSVIHVARSFLNLNTHSTGALLLVMKQLCKHDLLFATLARPAVVPKTTRNPVVLLQSIDFQFI
jgi:hypothetical protein